MLGLADLYLLSSTQIASTSSSYSCQFQPGTQRFNGLYKWCVVRWIGKLHGLITNVKYSCKQRLWGQAPVQQQVQCMKSKNSKNRIYWNNRYDLKGSGLLGLEIAPLSWRWFQAVEESLQCENKHTKALPNILTSLSCWANLMLM